IVYHAHGGFVIGSESLGGAKNISVRNCIFLGTDVGLRFKSLRGRGGLIEDIFVDGVRMRSIVNEAILFDMYYGGGSPEVEALKNREEPKAEPVNDLTPRFQNFVIKNIVCDGASRPLLIDGLPEMPVRDVTITGVFVRASAGCLIQDAQGITLRDAQLSIPGGIAFDVHNSTQIALKHIVVPSSTETYLRIQGSRTNGISIVKEDASRAKNRVEVGPEASNAAITTE
ncbi:MAG TPA: hypothetical protein VFO86_09965, partial [Terriglobia bacterium]|nr:hypothetical protein [Terriglobia bacterium]